MSVTTHVYTATLKGTPDRVLAVRGGTLTLDAGNAPHVQGRLEIAVPSQTVLGELDPRLNKRIVVTANARTFNLHLRDRAVRHSDGVVEIAVASDEALLSDYAPLTDDITPRSSEASLRSVINYVLNKVSTGAALAASPSIDANITRYWQLTNLLTNPSLESAAVGTGGWLAGTGASALTRTLMGSPVAPFGSYALGWTAAAGDSNVVPATTASPTTFPATPGRWYTFTFYIASSVARSARAAIQWWSSNGTVLSSSSFGTSVTTNATAFQRVTITVQAPQGASHLFPFVNTLANAAGNLHYVDGAMLYEGDELVPYFDGASAGVGYTYTWANAAHGSTSTRTPVVARDKESLTWSAGQSAMDFLAPLAQAVGYRLVCNEARVWTLRNKDYAAAGALSIRHAVNLVDGTDSIARDSGIWFDAAVTVYTWTDAAGVQRTVTDSYALVTPHTRLMRFDRDTPYPGPGFSQYAVTRAQQRGREVSATAVSDWTANAEQAITIVLENAPTQVGATTAVEYDLSRDEMTVTTRTTDTPLGAIDLLTGTIDSLTGTIDSL